MFHVYKTLAIAIMFLEAKKLYFSPALNVSVVQKCPQPESAVHGSLLAPCFLLAC